MELKKTMSALKRISQSRAIRLLFKASLLAIAVTLVLYASVTWLHRSSRDIEFEFLFVILAIVIAWYPANRPAR